MIFIFEFSPFKSDCYWNIFKELASAPLVFGPGNSEAVKKKRKKKDGFSGFQTDLTNNII